MKAGWFRVAMAAALACPLLTASACGPDFPNTFLDQPDVFLKSMPEGNFAVEMVALERDLIAQGVLTETNWPSGDSTSQADIADLKAALGMDRVAVGQPDVILNYEVFRLCLSQFDMPDLLAPRDAAQKVAASGLDLKPPAGIPVEFDRYGRGAAAYRGGDLEKARSEWVGVLALPPAQRHYRSTWAAFMLGKTWLRDDSARAIDCFQIVRMLARAGFADTLGLARESVGWEARAELDRCDFEKAALLYFGLRPVANSVATDSLLAVARKIVSLQRFDEAAASRVLQGLVTAYFVSRADYAADREYRGEVATRWLEAVEQAGLKTVTGTDRLAWIAYQHGNMEAAARWEARAPADSVIARWVRAKLLLREGRTSEAEALMSGIVGTIETVAQVDLLSFAATDVTYGYRAGSQPAGELASLLMSDGRYREALDLLLRNGWWTDGAYVAERVLTLDELRLYVDEQWPETQTLARRRGGEECYDWWYYGDHPLSGDASSMNEHIRYLLARRLARSGRLMEARPYYSGKWRSWLDEYTKAIARGGDCGRTDAVRAAALWRAARIMRQFGMELFGCELGPDWHLYGGDYELPYLEMRSPTNPPVAAFLGADEWDRVASSAAKPEVRFHYRYAAADLSWEAAGLMPDDSPVTALVLCRAGTWLAGRDPKAADRFYKALVRRCGRTSLGREADRRRWFPIVESLPVLHDVRAMD
jgi:hypothetical protein